VNTLDLQQSQPLMGGPPDMVSHEKDRECCCITLKRYREFGAALRKYDRNTVQPIFGGQYATVPNTPISPSTSSDVLECVCPSASSVCTQDPERGVCSGDDACGNAWFVWCRRRDIAI